MTRDKIARQIRRAVAETGIKRLADLDDLAAMEKRLLKLAISEANPDGYPLKTLRDGFQDPLRRLSKWLAGNKRHLPLDPSAARR